MILTVTMGHIFVSYSHKDAAYVHKLREKLIAEGFEPWIDDRIDYGDEWPMVIQEQLDSCDAFILVATEDSYKSKWVQKEVTRAQRINKPFFPLLLSGHPWLSIESTQYADVHDKSLPPEKFYRRLARVSPRRKASTLPSDLKQKSIARIPPNLLANKAHPTNSKLANINTYKPDVVISNKGTASRSSFIQKVITQLRLITNRLQKTSRRVKFSIAIITLLFLIFFNIQTRQWRTNFEAAMPTTLATVTLISLEPTWTPDLFAISTYTPVIAQSTITTNPATATVGAAFTMIALESTYTAIPSPTLILEPSQATLTLDNNYLCLDGPGKEYNTTTTLVKGIKLPIYGQNNEKNWWLVQVQLSNFENNYCWINGGIMEGDSASIKIIIP